MFVNVELIYNNTYKFIQFTYEVPKKYVNSIFVGSIVEVFFRKKKYSAVVVEMNVQKPNAINTNEIKNILYRLSEDQVSFLTHLSVSNYLNIGILLSEVFDLDSYKNQLKNDRKFSEQNSTNNIVNYITKKYQNVFICPSLELCNKLFNKLTSKGINIDFVQKTGGREEISNFINSNNHFENVIILSNNFNYLNITNKVMFHFYDTNNISYKLPKLNGINIIELAILKNNIFGGNFRFYNIFPTLDMFNSYDHYENFIIENDITYIYGNNLEECINILKNKIKDKTFIPYSNSETLKSYLKEYSFTDNLLNKDTNLYLLFNPKINYNKTLNSLRLVSLINDLQYCAKKSIGIILISTKEQNLQEMLKLVNLKNLGNNEIKERKKYGPNIDTKIFTFSTNNQIPTSKYDEYLLGPRKDKKRFEYEMRLNLSKNFNYNKIMKLFSYTNKYNPTKNRNI